MYQLTLDRWLLYAEIQMWLDGTTMTEFIHNFFNQSTFHIRAGQLHADSRNPELFPCPYCFPHVTIDLLQASK